MVCTVSTVSTDKDRESERGVRFRGRMFLIQFQNEAKETLICPSFTSLLHSCIMCVSCVCSFFHIISGKSDFTFIFFCGNLKL